MSYMYHRSLVTTRPVQITVLLAFSVLLFLGFSPLPTRTVDYFKNQNVTGSDVSLVVASQQSDNTTWVHSHLHGWQKHVYIVDDPQAGNTVPRNKGHEAMVYLTYIIDHYDHLPPVSIFIHAERYQWHNDDPDYDGLRLLSRLNTSHIVSQGYANLRCTWVLGCPSEMRPRLDASKLPTAPRRASEIYAASFAELFPGLEVPEVVGTTCCAQFAVSRDAIRARSRDEYEGYRRWILETELEDDLSGRVLEYAWHIIFGKQAVFCPEIKSCYCDLYGICNLDCENEQSCAGQYTMPKYSNLPPGWPELDWDGRERILREY